MSLANQDDESLLVKNSKKIVEGIELLNEEYIIRRIECVMSMDSGFKIERITEPDVIISHEELVQNLSQYGKLGDRKQVQFRS